MDITQERIDDLNAVLRISITSEDYKDVYESALRETRKKVNTPGFRPGKMPLGLVKKMYGAKILVEELEKLINESIGDYIRKEKLSVLGRPLPREADERGSWEKPDNFEFAYDLGLAPDIQLDLHEDATCYPYRKIRVDEDLIEKQIDSLTDRFGEWIEAEESDETDILYGDLVELDVAEEIKEGGIMCTSEIFLKLVENEETKEHLMGRKAGEIVVVKPKDFISNGADFAGLFHVSEEEVEAANAAEAFNFRIAEIRRMEKHAVDQELFDKAFGEEEGITNEADFRARVAKDIEQSFVGRSDHLFFLDVSKKLMETLDLPLPDAFLKRYLKTTSKDELTDEQIEEEYKKVAKGLHWQLIRNCIASNHNIEVEETEVINFKKELLSNQYLQYGLLVPEDEELTQMALNILKGNQDEYERTFNSVLDQKIMHLLKSTLKIENEEMSFDDFFKLTTEQLHRATPEEASV